MTKWEYKVLHSGGRDQEPDLNELGQLGWELVGVMSGNESFLPRFYFKRLIKDEHESSS